MWKTRLDLSWTADNGGEPKVPNGILVKHKRSCQCLGNDSLFFFHLIFSLVEFPQNLWSCISNILVMSPVWYRLIHSQTPVDHLTQSTVGEQTRTKIISVFFAVNLHPNVKPSRLFTTWRRTENLFFLNKTSTTSCVSYLWRTQKSILFILNVQVLGNRRVLAAAFFKKTI